MSRYLTLQLALLGAILAAVFACYTVLATLRDTAIRLGGDVATMRRTLGRQVGYLKDMRDAICTDTQESFQPLLPQKQRP